MDRPPPHGVYATREVAALLGMSPAQIRACARAGFVAPEVGSRGELLFSFQDLVLLRTAKALLAARIPRRRIRIALQNLHAQLPQGQPLTAVRISAQGQQVVARDGGDAWHPESGQTLLDFEVADLARQAAALEPRRLAPLSSPSPLPAMPAPGSSRGLPPPTAFRGPALVPPAAAAAPGPSEAEAAASAGAAADWYEHAVELEAGDPAAAVKAYRRALALDPDLADAHLNLGRLLHEAGDLEGAEMHYRQALALDPDDPLATYNLGVALQDQQRPRQAATAYEQALALDPSLADAHFNLSGVYEQLGDKAAAFRHLRTYGMLTGSSGPSGGSGGPAGHG
ncbi:MAG TPA: tetratricopeptide repeat protein [Thermoanaerobaculia bacterium]|jgi:tetratricopeptide (TPR) repeat protein|nr:tetratricopeptide repeat protein [Thermoanaerobaculia bacterium]